MRHKEKTSVSKQNPSISPSSDDAVNILLAAYQKHSTELLAIEGSQEKMINLVLAIYSVGTTLMAAVLKDARALLQGPAKTLSEFGWVLIVFAVLIGIYATIMSVRRSRARQSVRWALTQIDQALGFFTLGRYLQNQQLYPDEWLNFSRQHFLDRMYIIVILAGLAFIATVYSIAVS